jgi:Icc-related predicted phosphoesterase
MRFLHVADLHYSLPQLDWLADVAPRFDVVVLAGDLLDLASLVDFGAQILVVQKYLRRISGQTRLILCSGNHDLDMPGERGEKVAAWLDDLEADGITVDGQSLTVGDTLFTVCPWWDGPRTQEAIAEQLAADARRRLARWVWAHHAPPESSPTSWTGSRSMGDRELVAWIDAFGPDIVLSGHVHQSPFIRGGSWADRVGRTWIFNTGHQFGAPPAHVIVDTDAGEALWISAMGAQTVRLDQPLERPIPTLASLPGWFTADAGRVRTPG